MSLHKDKEALPSFDRLVDVWRGLLVESPANKNKLATDKETIEKGLKK
tara:strand:- start:433 stop:576 length:144 start_codon:yes stop_codon:yes gene_type:complete